MRRDFKNLFSYLLKYSRGKTLFSSGPEWSAFYLFLIRYDAIKDDLGLPYLGYKLDKYRHGLHELNPSEDLIKPFIEFLRQERNDHRENGDLYKYFKNLSNSLAFERYEIKALNEAIINSGVKKLSLKNYSIDEFDEFFTAIINEIVSQSRNNYDKRFLNKNFAQFINKNIPNKSHFLLIGDETAELACQIKSGPQEIILAGDEDSIFWFYLRTVLRGKQNVRIIQNELASFIREEPDFIFLNPPIGRLNKEAREYFTREFKVPFKFTSMECFYAKLALDEIRQNGRAFFLMPTNFLFSENKDYRHLRERVIKDGSLKTIIRLPKGLFWPYTTTSFSLIDIDYSKKYDRIKFIDAMEIATFVSYRDSGHIDKILNRISEYWRYEHLVLESYVALVNKDDVIKNNYSWAISNYINISNSPSRYIRSSEEKLVPLTQLLKRINLKKADPGGEVPILGISQLREDAIEFNINYRRLPKTSEIKRAKRLEQSAILLGKIVGSIKPSYFNYDGNGIFVKPNVLAFKKPENCDLQYLIQELRSDFVMNQFKKIESGVGIPSFSNRVLNNIYLRIPPLEKQKEIVKNELSKLAKESLNKLEISSNRFRLIERELIGSFKHDFGKILLKVSSNILTLEGYLNRLHKEGIINLNDSIFPITKSGKQQNLTVSDVLDRLKGNHQQAQIYLDREIKKLSGEIGSNKDIIDLKMVIKDWLKKQNDGNFTFNFTDDQLYPKGNEYVQKSSKTLKYLINGNVNDIHSILDNFLDNAVNYGFTEQNRNYEFRIHLQFGINGTDIENTIKLHVGNDGDPFPEDFSCTDFFKYKYKGPNSKGDGIGGYSIARTVENLGGEISCQSSFLSEDQYPVQFEISFKHMIIDNDE